MNRTLFFSVCCLCGVLAATVFHFRHRLVLPFGDARIADVFSENPVTGRQSADPDTPVNPQEKSTAGWPSFAPGIDKAAPSVVSVYTLRTIYSDQELSQSSVTGSQTPRQGRQTNQGSGVVVDASGLIVTSHHLIAEADTIYIALADDSLALAEIVGVDMETDLALIRISASKPLTPLSLDETVTARVGDVVLAIGNPYGVGQTVTLGIVSAVKRQLTGVSALQNFLQIDAAINPGNSGGALIDPAGGLMGINTAVYSRLNGAQGIGFAIPVSLVRKVVPQLLEHGRVIRGWLGIGVDDLINYPNLFTGPTNGAVVVAVFDQGPAYEAGLRPGDILVAVDHKPIRRSDALLTDIAATSPGTQLLLSIERDRQAVDITVTLAERPPLSSRP